MFLRRLGKRGTAIVEYAIILAFVAAVGSSFTSDAGMAGSIKSIIGNVNQLLGVAAGKEEGKLTIAGNAEQWSELLDDLYNKVIKANPNPDGKLMEIKIYQSDVDGNSKIQYSYYDDYNNNSEYKKTMNLLFNSGEKSYYFQGDNFIRFDYEGAFSEGTNSNPMRIQIAEQGTKKPIEYISYSKDSGAFYATVGYFGNLDTEYRNPKQN